MAAIVNPTSIDKLEVGTSVTQLGSSSSQMLFGRSSLLAGSKGRYFGRMSTMPAPRPKGRENHPNNTKKAIKTTSLNIESPQCSSGGSYSKDLSVSSKIQSLSLLQFKSNKLAKRGQEGRKRSPDCQWSDDSLVSINELIKTVPEIRFKRMPVEREAKREV